MSLARSGPGSQHDALDPVERAEPGVEVGQLRHEQLAGVDRLDGVRATPELSGSTIDHVERHLVAVAERWPGGNGRMHDRVIEASQMPQLALDNRSLHLELAFVRRVLPLTATTRRKVWAGRFDPHVGRFNDLAEPGLRERAAIDHIDH